MKSYSITSVLVRIRNWHLPGKNVVHFNRTNLLSKAVFKYVGIITMLRKILAAALTDSHTVVPMDFCSSQPKFNTNHCIAPQQYNICTRKLKKKMAARACKTEQFCKMGLRNSITATVNTIIIRVHNEIYVLHTGKYLLSTNVIRYITCPLTQRHTATYSKYSATLL